MKTFRSLFILLAVALCAGVAVAAETPGKIKVLVVTGGHGFDKEPFFKMFSENTDITFTAAAHARTNATAYERDDFLSYDVVVIYDMMRRITERQKAQFTALTEKGVGLVVLHHALVAFADWPDYERIIGGRYNEPVPDKPGTVTEAVGWKHDEIVPVVIVAKDHPITAGLKDFTIHDEIYWGYRVQPDVTPLITTTHPKSGKPLGWCRTEGISRVVYLQLGHGPEAFNDANYRKLLAQSIRWTAKR
jgi:type 1 glutamine amidotransferase